MVRFPEQDPRQLPEFPLTSTQQRWKAKQTESLTARRTWKSTQMGLVALCMPFKTFLVREFGEDYIGKMMDEYKHIDLGSTHSAQFNTAITTLMGPARDELVKPAELPEGASQEDISAYQLALVAYETNVAEQKAYVGVPTPDTETATRILTLVVKLRLYRESAEAAELEGMELAVNSLCNAEIPTPALLRSVASQGLAWKNGVVSSPIDFAKFGITSDDPSSWNGKNAFHAVLVTPWLKNFKKDLISDEYAQYVRIRNSTTASDAMKRQYGWSWVFRLWAERAFGVKYDSNGYYREYRGGKFYIGTAMLFYAKAFGRMADPLQFWGTHSRYRLNATNMGSKGIVVELSEVDARIGAPSNKTAAVAVFPSGSTGSAIATVKSFFPYLMDVEGGNNPTLDKFIGDTVSQRKISAAGAEFAKQPPSARAGYRYVACTKTVLAFPGTILYHPEWDSMVLSSANVNPKLKEDNPAFDMWMAYSKKAEQYGSGRVSRLIRDRISGVDGDVNYHRFINGPLTVEHGNAGMNGQFSWSAWYDKEPPLIKQCVLGVPSPHKDARVITTLSVALVPAHFDTAIREIEKAMQEVSGSTAMRKAMTGVEYPAPSEEWTNLSNALIALTSGHWAMEGAWIRTGNMRKDYSANTLFSTMGIASSTTYTERASNGTANLQGVIAVLKKYGLYDLSGVKTVFEGPVNDLDDIANVMSDFKQAYPDVSELVMPDTADPSKLVLSARPLHTNVTSLAVAPIVNIPRLANGEYGSYMVRRVPINTKGVSGKTYRFGDRTSAMSNLMLSTNTYDMEVPGGMSGVGTIAGIGGLVVAGMLTVAGISAISR